MNSKQILGIRQYLPIPFEYYQDNDRSTHIYLSLTHEQDLIIIFNNYSTFPLVDDNNLSIS